ncbi:MAG: ABC transporter substrate-binding protein [Agrococcus casei]
MQAPPKSRLTRAAAMAAAVACVFGMAPMAASATVAPLANESSDGPAVTPDSSATTLRIATSGFVDSFNPFTSIYLTPTGIFRQVYENLVQYSAEDGSPTEGLAESWETSEDGMTWTYKIREGMQWSDGEPLTAADPEWTYTQMMEVPEMGSANGGLVSSFESVEATDEHTLVITLSEPQAANPGVEIPIVPKHIWSELDNPVEYANDEGDVVGSGPFTIESYAQNQSIELAANPNFWRGAPNFERIQYVYYTNSDAMVQALRAGEIDIVTGLSPTQFDALEGQDNVVAHSGQGRRYTSLALNPGFQTADGEEFGTGSEALKDVEVRQAIRKGIDAQTLLTQVLDDQGTLATSFIPASFPDWHLSEDNPVIMDYDVEAAKSQLEDAGWTEGSDGVREKDGERLALTILIDADSPLDQASGEFLVPWMAEIGIELNVEMTDSDTISTKVTAGEYDMYFSGWSMNSDPDYQLGINTCANLPTETDGSGGTTQDGYCDPKFDELYNQQHVELDEAKRQEIVQEMLAMNYEASVQIAFWYGNQLEAYRSDRVGDFTLQPTDNGVIMNQSGYWALWSAEPLGDGSGGGGASTGLLVAGGAAAVLVVGGVIFWMVRRKNAGDVE